MGVSVQQYESCERTVKGWKKRKMSFALRCLKCGCLSSKQIVMLTREKEWKKEKK